MSNNTFLEDVEKGLSSKPKYLESKYFYNEKGDKLFQEIMKMEEYYLTNSEFEILENNKKSIIDHVVDKRQEIQLVELGAGDGFKTKLLLKHLMDENISFEYKPIDISGDVLEDLKNDLLAKWTNINITPINANYFEGLSSIRNSGKPKLVLFLGSNIGNFEKSSVSSFLGGLYDSMQEGDFLLLGVDLKKDPEIILNAYNDSKGITKAFNFNLLNRINEELGGNFDLTQFKHYPIYNPLNGETKSFLISKNKQEVYIKTLDKSYSFDYAEPIQMEVSNKYQLDEIELILSNAGFSLVENYFDCKQWYLNTLIKK